MSFPRTTVFGHGVLGQTSDICDSLLFGEDGIIITGEKTYKAAGKMVEDNVSEKYNAIPVFTGGCDRANIDKAEEAAREVRATFVLAVGGGSKIDTAKMVSKELRIPFISIPTSIAHDGVCSDRASMKDDTGNPLTVKAEPPIAVIADTGVLVKAPYRYLASGCADVISNKTALTDWDLGRKVKGEEFSNSAYALANYAAESLLNDADRIKPGLEESVWLVLKPVIASGVSMCIAGTSRPTSGSEHMFSHAIDLLYPGRALHGEQTGVGCIMMTCLQGGDWKRIRDALKSIGAPTTAAGIGLTPDECIEAVVKAPSVRKDRYTIFGEEGITRNRAEEIARTTGVI
jgi:glycerol-1-phosphate dehydrogenase [NAD(P)+]